MFPNRFDRYRLMGYIVRQIRESSNLTHPTLAKKLKIAKGTIYHLENFKPLAEAARNGRRPVARDIFIRTMLQGLGLSPQDVEALLWLVEGDEFEPLREEEVSAAAPGYSATHVHTGENGSRGARVLHLLRRAIDLARIGEEVSVRMLTGWDEGHQVRFRKDLYKMERKPGQRLLISKYPSYLTCPQNVYEDMNRGGGALSAKSRARIQQITDRRRKFFRENIREYGERCIHSLESIKRYVRGEFKHFLSPEERIEHVRNLIALLENKDYKFFEVGLAQAEPEIEFVIKCGWAACLRGTSRDIRSNPDSVICGPLYVYWEQEAIVYSFMLDFEYAWNSLPQEQRDKDNVVAQLKTLIGQ